MTLLGLREKDTDLAKPRLRKENVFFIPVYLYLYILLLEDTTPGDSRYSLDGSSINPEHNKSRDFGNSDPILDSR